MRTKTITLILFLLLMVVGGAQAQEGNWSDNRDTDWGGDYESATTFVISNPQQMAQFAYMVNNGQDFSSKVVKLDDGQEEEDGETFLVRYKGELYAHAWVPIGTPDHPFNGTFDGNGKSVTYVTIEASDSYQGFFGYIGQNGMVKNLVFDYGSSISGTTQVGTLAGYNAGTVQYCLVLNTTVSGTGYVGTIIGQNEGTVTGCYSIDSRYKVFAVGAEGSDTGVDVDGAQCLYNIKADEDDLDDDDFTASVGTKMGITVGNAVYYDDGVQYNYYHWYKTGTEVTLTSNLNGYDVTFSVSGVGASIDGNVVTVGTEKVTVSLASTTPAEWSGTGTEEDPYLIYNREQLDMLATRVNDGNSYEGQFFRLEDYLDYSDNEGRHAYTVIGIDADHPFSGTFDGNGKEISDADATSTGPYVGHFGYNKGTIKNLSFEGSEFQGCGYVGVIAGYNGGTIENCRVKSGSSALIGGNGSYQYFGGVAGYNTGTIKTTVCAANVRIGYYYDEYNNPAWFSEYNVSHSGGIAGYSEGTIENCLYLGRELKGSSYVGTIAGQFNGGGLTNNYYHNNQYRDLGSGINQADDNIGTEILGVGVSGGIIGSDEDGAKQAKVVKLTEGGTFANPYGVGLAAEPTFVTTNNTNGKAVSVYEDGILFDDGYMGSPLMDNAFYTTATTVELTASDVPTGYVATFTVVEGENSTIDGATLTIGDDIVVVKADAERGVDSNSWLAYRAASFSNIDEDEKKIVIHNPEELSLLAYNVNFENKTYKGYTIALYDHINLSGHTWEPIGYLDGGNSSGMGGIGYGMGSDMGGFLGTFDGVGYGIINMNTEYPGNVGLFSIIGSEGVVKNLCIGQSSVKGGRYVGGVAGMNSGTIENCHVYNTSLKFSSVGDEEEEDETGSYPGALNPSSIAMGFGGIAGICQGGTIKGCTVNGTNIDVASITTAWGVGGITGGASPGVKRGSGSSPIGMVIIPATIKDCLFTGNIFVPAEGMGIGAIIGMDQSDDDDPNTITNNYYVDGNDANATPNTTLHGIGGQAEGEDTDGAMRGYVYLDEDEGKPDNIGEIVTEYGDWGLIAYQNGIRYEGCYYMATPPAVIILADKEDPAILNSDVLLFNAGVISNVTIDGRTLYKDGNWNTLCLPFSLTAEQIANSVLSGAEIRTLTDARVTGYHVDLSFGVEEEIHAGEAYLIKWESGDDIVSPTFEGVTIVPEIKELPFADGHVTFSGYYDKFEAKNTDVPLVYFLTSDNTLKYPSSNRTMYPFRAFFTFTANNGDNDSGANTFDFSIDFGDGVVDGVTFTKEGRILQADKWFTIDGRQLVGKPTAKGVYLHNGKTIVVK